MHIKRTHLTPEKLAIIQNTTNIKYWCRCGESSCILLGKFVGTATMENSTQVLKKLTLQLPCDAGITLGSIFLMKQNHGSKKIYTPLCSWHFADNSQHMEPPKCPLIDKWIKKFSYMNGPKGYHAK